MTAPRRRCRSGAGVGAAVVILLVVALCTLGGRGAGDPAGRPETLDRGQAAQAQLPGLDRRMADAVGGSIVDPLHPVGTLLAGPPGLLVALVLLGLVAAATLGTPPPRPAPVRVGRGPPARRR